MSMRYLSWLLLSLALIGLGYAAVQWWRRRQTSPKVSERNLQWLVVMFLVLMAGAVLVNLVVSLYSGQRAVLDQMQDSTSTLAHVVQEQTASNFASVEVALTLLAHTEGLQRPTVANRESTNDLLAENVRHLSFVRAIWVLDAKGDMIRDSERLPGHYNLAERRYFQWQRDHPELGIFIDRPTLSKHGVWFLPVSHRIEDAQGRFAGVVTAAVEPHHLRRYFDSLDVGKSGFVVLMYEDGTLLHASRGNSLKPGQTLTPSPPFVEQVKHSSRGSYRFQHPRDNVDRINSYRRVGQRPLVIVVGLGVREQLATWQRTAGAYALASVVFLLAIVILGARLLRELTRQRRQSARIADLNRIKDLLGATNQLIVRTRSRRELLEGACRIAVEKGGFGLAWVEAIDRARGELRPFAHAGEDAERVLADDIIRYDNPQDAGLVTDCFLTGEATWVNELEQLPQVGAARWRRALACGYHSAIALPLKDGDDVHTALVLLDHRSALFDTDELKLLGALARDISFALEHISRREHIEYLGHYDALTGLPNRGLFLEHASRCLEDAQRQQRLCAVVKFDIERFHKINEAAGWHSGDELLQVVGQRLKAALGDDTSAARTERDHFAFLITDEQRPEDITHRVQHILHACFAEPVIIEGQVLRLAARAGVSVFPADGASPERLMRNAEAALMHTKQASERMMFYAPEMNARVAESVALESRLRGALMREEFVLHYQPRYDASTGDMVGLEGLLRWNDPDVGLTYPAHFISLLEETGLILDVGEWVMRKAIADYGHWRAMNLKPPRIAVNVSAMQLHQHDFYARVQRAIDTAAHTDHGLDVEITESMLIGHVEHSVDQLGRLREMGVCIAIDDFGTGYSSLQYLARLPLDALKIDRSFVIGMPENSTDREIVSTVISLAHHLQLKVVAEGVETEQQAQMLRQAHCDEMQGFLFAKPMPGERIEQILRDLRVTRV